MTSADLDEEALATLDLLAFLNLHYGRTQAADKLYKFLLNMRAEDPRLLRAAALACHLNGDSEEALELGRKALRHSTPTSPEALATHLLLSEVLSALNRPDEAFTHSRQYLDLRATLS